MKWFNNANVKPSCSVFDLEEQSIGALLFLDLILLPFVLGPTLASAVAAPLRAPVVSCSTKNN